MFFFLPKPFFSWLLKLDLFLISLVCAALLGFFLPCPESLRPFLKDTITFLIVSMFFFQGARVQPAAIMESLGNWRLQGLILFLSYVTFPIIGIFLYESSHLLPANWNLSPMMWGGILFLCCLPAADQASVVMTSIAKGNIAAAICGASLSNIAGIIITPLLAPLLVGLVLSRHGDIQVGGTHAIITIGLELLLPFILGQICRRWLVTMLEKYRRLMAVNDRSAIIIIVYGAFSLAVSQGLSLSGWSLFLVAIACAVLLASMLSMSWWIARIGLKQSVKNAIACQFCGSKKALSAGVVMVTVIFGPEGSSALIPLVLFHQFQLFGCAALAKKHAKTMMEQENH